MRSRHLVRALLALGIAAPAGASDVQPWPTLSLRVALPQHWFLVAETTGRIAGDERPSQFEERVLIGRTVASNLAVAAGWTHYANFNPDAPDGAEDQATEQLAWTAGTLGGIRIASRTRFEQRFVHRAGETGWRLREQVRGTLPLGRSRVSAVMWAEPFVAVNHTAFQRRTLDQLRTFAGVTVAVSPRADVEIGYLNRYIHRSTGYVDDDVVPIVLSLRL